MNEEVIAILLAAIAARRLVIFTGAGLSMPAPSNLPSAKQLARECARKHEMNTGETLPAELTEDIEALARLFYGRAQLQGYFLQKLVDWDPFLGEPNAGHHAIADLLLCGAADLTVSANVDALIEIGGESLGQRVFEGAVDGAEAAVVRDYQPLLKIHGCARRKAVDTLWCREQLSEPEWEERIADTVRWLAGRLTQRDIVFVGYWTDWAYLNDVLARVIEDGLPRSVTLIDPAPPSVLEEKAPALWEWAHRDGILFNHVQLSGAQFLEELRRRFSRSLLMRIADAGRETRELFSGGLCPDFPSFAFCTMQDLYDIRRDWSGVRRDAVTRRNDALTSDELLGKMFYDILAAGGVPEGNSLVINGQRVRLFQASGRMLYSVKADLGGDVAAYDAPDVTVCVGAHDDGGVPQDVVRAGRSSTIIRPGLIGTWCTHEGARAMLGI